MATVSAEAEKQHPQVMTVREGGDAVSVPETDRVGSDGRKRLESESEVDDRASDVVCYCSSSPEVLICVSLFDLN